MDRAVLDDGVGGGVGDLRRNGKARAGERAAVGDDEGVDADQFAMGIDQRAAGVAGLMAASVWIYSPGLRGHLSRGWGG